MIQTIITPLLITLLISGILFFYFKNRLSVTERKVNLMFDLIQEHEKQVKQYSYQTHGQPIQQLHTSDASHQYSEESVEQPSDLNQILEESLPNTLDHEQNYSTQTRELIDVSDESDTEESDTDVSDDGRLQLSENTTDVPLHVKNITLSLEGANTGPMKESPTNTEQTLANKHDIKEINLDPVNDNELNDISLSDDMNNNNEDNDDDDDDEEDDDKQITDMEKLSNIMKQMSDIPLSKLNVKDLKGECKKRNLTGYAKMKKNALIELLTKKTEESTN